MTLSAELGRIVHSKLLLGGGSRPQHSSSSGAVFSSACKWTEHVGKSGKTKMTSEVWTIVTGRIKEPLSESLPGLQFLLASGFRKGRRLWRKNVVLRFRVPRADPPSFSLFCCPSTWFDTQTEFSEGGRCESKCMLGRLHLQNAAVV